MKITKENKKHKENREYHPRKHRKINRNQENITKL